MKFKIKNLEDLEKFAKILAENIKEEDVFSLVGDLGAGKTTLVQLIGKYLGIEDYITSPTFSLVNIYNGDFEVNHLDLYRLEDPDELLSIDFETYFYPQGVTFIEWAEKAGDYIPEDIIEIKINLKDEFRIIEFASNTSREKELEEIVNENFSS